MKKLLLLHFLLFCATIVSAQQDSTGLLSIDFQHPIIRIVPEIELGYPVGDFLEAIDQNTLGGVCIGVYFPIKRSDLEWGFRFGGLTYDKIKRYYSETISGLEVDYVQKTKNKIWLWHGQLQYLPPLRTTLKPYLEATVGVERFFPRPLARSGESRFYLTMFCCILDSTGLGFTRTGGGASEVRQG